MAGIRAVLRVALNRALKWKRVAWNVAALADPPRAKRYEARTLSPDEARAFLAAAEGNRLGPLFSVALALGLRLGEALALAWADVDLEARTLRVRRSLQRIGKSLEFVDTKSARSRRNLRIPDVAVKVLAKHRANQNRERLAMGEKWIDSGLVFTSTIGTALDERNVRRDFDAILKAAELPHIRIHDLRHTCASLLLAHGVHPRVAMEILGHSEISITLDRTATSFRP